MCSLKMCLAHDTWYSVSASVSWEGLALLLSTGPYSVNSGTSASCCAYADCASAAVWGGGVAAFDVEGTPIVSKLLGPVICVSIDKYMWHYDTHEQTP